MIQWLEITSKALQGAPVAGATTRRFPVYLPPKYESQGSKRYPTAYVLSGWGSKSSSYISESSAFGGGVCERLDIEIQAGRIPAVICVFHDGSTPWGGSQYVNSPIFGAHSDYLCDEVVTLVDQSFRTEAIPEKRIIMGHSSGGYGALWNAANRPDRFLYCGSSAADSYFEFLFTPLIRLAIEEFEKAGSPEKFVRDFLAHPNPLSQSRPKGETMMLLCMLACYLPNSKSPTYGDFYFDLKTGERIDGPWKRLLEWDPLQFLRRLESNLKQLKFIQLDHGKSDEYGLQLGQRQVADFLEAKKIPFGLEEYSGGHSGQSWRLPDLLGRILKAHR